MNQILQRIAEKKSLLNKAEAFVHTHEALLTVLDSMQLVKELQVTEDGLVFVPNKDVYQLFDLLTSQLNITFTRQSDDYHCYQWMSTKDGVLLTIQANEIIDHTGEIPTNPQQ